MLIEVEFEKLKSAFAQLRPFIQHTCLYNKTDSPDGDVCQCDKSTAVNNFIHLMDEHFKTLRREEFERPPC